MLHTSLKGIANLQINNPLQNLFLKKIQGLLASNFSMIFRVDLQAQSFLKSSKKILQSSPGATLFNHNYPIIAPCFFIAIIKKGQKKKISGCLHR
ncbi:MAG: hypothetical protein V4619_15265 [Bacteroidota bacterium]